MTRLYVIIVLIFGAAMYATGQTKTVEPAEVGAQYGKKINSQNAIDIRTLVEKLKTSDSFNGKIQGEVLKVCKKKGCFIMLKNKDDEEPIMIRFKDYAFFMPQNIVGKTVVIEGLAKTKIITIDQQKHAAADMGKSKEEIEKITKPKNSITVIANGVVVTK